MAKIIEVERFIKRYGGFEAVKDISFTVDEGSIFAFLGPNGAGKSTTINALCTVLSKTSGSLRVCGYDVTEERDKVRRQVGLVFQESTLDSKLSVEENLRFHCDFYDVPLREVNDRIAFALDLVDLQEWRKAQVAGLSGGMKRRVEIARGLVHTPRVLFLDEPTAGLDPQTRAHIWEYVQKLQKQSNLTIFLTTHYMDEAEICDHVAIMDHGEIVAFDTPANLKRQHTCGVVKVGTSDDDALLGYLAREGIGHVAEPGGLHLLQGLGTRATVNLVADLRDIITDIQVTSGTLNDVFLAIAGREIRA